MATAASLEPAGALGDALRDSARHAERQARADRLLEAEGAGHLVHDLPVRGDGRAASTESRPWRIDPTPVVVDAPTFRFLAAAVSNRMRGLAGVLADLYGPRQLVRERVVPAEALASTPRYRINAVSAMPERWLATYAVDLALGHDGVWRVVHDLTDAPAGVGYALLDRSIMTRVVPEVMAIDQVASIARFPEALRAALAAASKAASPRTVLFSGGIDHPSYVEHSYLAVQLGVHLVEGADLVVRQRRVWLRTLDGLEPVDVLYRRLEDSTVDPLEVAASGTTGVPGLLQAVRSGGVTLANAHGTGVVEAPEVTPFVDAALERFGVTTLPRHRIGDPVASDVVVRLFAVDDGDEVRVLPGGTGRVLAAGDDPRLPTACVARDLWVLGVTPTPIARPRLPQVDFAGSVPTRAADALYWTNRAAERAEAMARTARVVASRLEQDPGLAELDGGAWVSRMIWMLGAVARRPFEPSNRAADLRAAIDAVGVAVADQIGSLLAEATTVREYLSVTTGRVLAHLAELRAALSTHGAGVDELDAVLADFAAFAGLWHESVVRGPAWRLGDVGRRLERVAVVLDLIESTTNGPGGDETQAAAIEVLLAASESLVAYRRRHRSDVELDAAVFLLVADDSNPRSMRAAIDRFAQSADEVGWTDGVAFADQVRQSLTQPLPGLVVTMRGVVEQVSTRIVERWFSSPVSAIPMAPTEGDLRDPEPVS